MKTAIPNKKLTIVSRCAWTLYKFRFDLAKDLRSRGYEVSFAGEADGFEEKLKAEGFQFYPIRGGKNGLGLLLLFLDLLILYRRLRPAIVHHYTIRPVLFGSLAAYFVSSVKICNTITGLGHTFLEGGSIFKRFLMAFYKTALARSERVFFQNQEDMNLFLERKIVSKEKSVLVPGSGVNLQRYKVSESTKERNTTRFLMVSRLIRQKGVLDYLEASRILKSRTDLEFHLLGDVDHHNPSSLSKDEAERLVSQAGVKWIRFQDDVRPLLDEVDVVVLPSYREGVPRSLLEAAAMGKALIATDVVGTREVVRDHVNGLLVPVCNPALLAQAMTYLADNNETRQEMGIKSRRIAETVFDERIVFERTDNVYRDLIERSQR
jgi:glycosyltransferase involved in cell wall biosynthesis